MWSVIIVCHRFHTSIRSGSDSRLESFKIQTCKSTLIMQLFWLFFQPHFFKSRSRLPPPYHFLPDRLCEPTIWRMIFASASVGRGWLSLLPPSSASLLLVSDPFLLLKFYLEVKNFSQPLLLAHASYLLLYSHSYLGAVAHTHSPEPIF